MPSFEFEDTASGLIAGIDEAGRGPWAGPVVAGVVVFLRREVDEFLLQHLDDSKKLSAKSREILYDKLLVAQKQGHILAALGEASVEEIDSLNILQATFLAMRRAVAGLGRKIDFAIVDGNRKPIDLGCDCMTLVKGDSRSYSVAAASILAKVTRDKYMGRLAQQYPAYGFDKNAGYGTRRHIEGLRQYGIIRGVHRLSYRPIAEIISASGSSSLENESC